MWILLWRNSHCGCRHGFEAEKEVEGCKKHQDDIQENYLINRCNINTFRRWRDQRLTNLSQYSYERDNVKFTQLPFSLRTFIEVGFKRIHHNKKCYTDNNYVMMVLKAV